MTQGEGCATLTAFRLPIRTIEIAETLALYRKTAVTGIHYQGLTFNATASSGARRRGKRVKSPLK
jgi:hypothetical protein